MVGHRDTVAGPGLPPSDKRRGARRSPIYLRVKRWRRDLLTVTEQLARIVRMNAPLAEGLAAAAVDAPNLKTEAILRCLHDDIHAGYSLAEAARLHRYFFPQYYVELVAAGERTGRLAECLCELAESLAEAEKTRAKLAGSFLYLGLVLMVQLLIAVFVAVKLAPVLAQMYTELGGPPPAMFAALVSIGAFVSNRPVVVLLAGGLILAFLSVLFVFGWLQRHGVPLLRNVGLLLLVPYVRGLVVRLDLWRVADVLSKLLGAGVPLDTSLENAASLDVGRRYVRALRRVAAKVRRGEPLAGALETEAGRFPRSFRALAALGESSALLPQAFEQIARQYQREARKRARVLIDTLAPLGVVVLGCLSLFVTGAVFTGYLGIVDKFIAAM